MTEIERRKYGHCNFYHSLDARGVLHHHYWNTYDCILGWYACDAPN